METLVGVRGERFGSGAKSASLGNPVNEASVQRMYDFRDLKKRQGLLQYGQKLHSKDYPEGTFFWPGEDFTLTVSPDKRKEPTPRLRSGPPLAPEKERRPRQKVDADMIDALPEGVWDRAQARARANEMPPGIEFKEAGTNVSARYLVHEAATKGRSATHASFSVNAQRDDLTARALAIARLMTLPVQQRPAKARTDAEVIAGIPSEVWTAARVRAAQPGLPTGVVNSRRTLTSGSISNSYNAVGMVNHKQTVLAGFSVTANRDEPTARAMAIATRMLSDQQHGTGAADRRRIAGFPEGIWEAAQARAERKELPSGVTLDPPSKSRKSASYQSHFQKESLGTFSVTDGRTDKMARTLAIAVRAAAEQRAIAAGQVVPANDEAIIERLGDALWERARTLAAQPALPPGVHRSLYGETNSVRFVATPPTSDSSGRKPRNFSVKPGRDEDMARTLAIATRLYFEKRA